jgi:TRAP-type C4-dicarboxylate transport system permease small subunit
MNKFAFLGGMVFLGLSILTMTHVIGRYFFNVPVPGMVEIVSVGQIAAIALGAAYIQGRKGHISVDILVNKFSKKKQAATEIFSHLIMAAFCAMASWQTFIYAGINLAKGRYLGTINISVAPYYYILAVGWVLMTVASIFKICEFAATIKRKGTSE